MRAHLTRLEISAATWIRESHGLFDFESNHLVRSQLAIRGSATLTLVENKCYQAADGFLKNAGHQLLEVALRDSDFVLRQSSSEKEIWVVVKSCRTPFGTRGVKLSQDDVLRLGRMLLKVRKSPSGPPIDLSSGMPVPEAPPFNGDTTNVICRICLSEAQSEENPFICPCHCDGTMKFIHIQCLREWLKSKVQVKASGSAVSYYWKPLTCELCKTDFPDAVAVDGKAVTLMELPELNSQCVVLEEVQKGSRPNKVFHIISFTGDGVVKLGRGHECDVRVPDISVSRFHALLKLVDRELYVEDRASKFGTLVLSRTPLTLTVGLTISVQVDRTVMDLRVAAMSKMKNFCLRCCCGQRQEDGDSEEAAEQLRSPPEPDVVSQSSSGSNIIENDLPMEDLEQPPSAPRVLQ